MAASSAESVSELSISLRKERVSFSWSVAEVREIEPVCWRAALPLFYQLFTVPLSPLLVDRVKVQYDQTDDHEKDGCSGNQHFQG